MHIAKRLLLRIGRKMIKDHGLLGELEIAVMNVLWEAGEPLDVKAVAMRLDGDRAYTTVMTTLQRLHLKGHLHREKDGRSFLYSPRLTQQSVVKRMLHRIADHLFQGDIRKLVPSIMGLDDELTDEQRQALRVVTKHIEDMEDE